VVFQRLVAVEDWGASSLRKSAPETRLIVDISVYLPLLAFIVATGIAKG
jgi:hypothetical protein